MRLRDLHPVVLAASLVSAPALAQYPAPPDPPSPPPPAVVPADRVPPGSEQGARVSRGARPASLVGRYQARGAGEQTDRFSRKVKLGRQGSVTVSNIAGDLVVTGGSGDEVTIEAVKRGRGDRAQLDSVRIIVDERPGRIEIRTDHTGRNDRVSVDYTITVPGDASVELHSVSGDVKITGVQGMARAETVSGSVTAARTPHLDRAKSVSGDVDLTDVASDADITAGSVSGSLHARGLKARSLDLNTVSGDLTLTDVTSERVGIRTVSGNIEYDGPLARNGRYEMNSHSGDVHLALPAGVSGFDLNASSFSGSIRSDLPLTVGGTGAAGGDRREMRRHGMGQSMRATYGDGSAVLTIRTFSGDVVISKK